MFSMEARSRWAVLIGLAVVGLCLGANAEAAVIGHWRAETDDDAGAGLSIPNEIGAGTPLTAPSAAIHPDVPYDPVPLTGAPNTGSIDGGADINGTIAHYAGLDAASITVEFFARTNEGTANMILRQDGAVGLRIDQPNNTAVQYSVDDGAGGSTQVSVTGLNNFDANWDHFAFTYDQATGLGRAYVNGVQAGFDNGPDGRALAWPDLAPMLVGDGYDGGGGLNGEAGIFDELRISDTALTPMEFLYQRPQTVGYWRMETDTNASDTAASVPNEVAGGNPLNSGSAALSPLVYGPEVLQTGQPNTASLAGLNNIAATVADYDLLNSHSITVEFFARSNEGDGAFVSRGGTDAGFSIADPDALDVSYWVEDGLGGSEQVVFNDLWDFTDDWDHVAWSYDALSGVGSVYVNGDLVARFDGPDNRALFWSPTADLSIGAGLDGGAGISGTGEGFFDELRISSVALPPERFLNTIPEPSTFVLAALGALGLILLGRRLRARQAA